MCCVRVVGGGGRRERGMCVCAWYVHGCRSRVAIVVFCWVNISTPVKHISLVRIATVRPDKQQLWPRFDAATGTKNNVIDFSCCEGINKSSSSTARSHQQPAVASWQ